MIISDNKSNIHRSEEQLKTKSKTIQNLTVWMAKIGKVLNVEQQSHYK
jgi:hypothetical protein